MKSRPEPISPKVGRSRLRRICTIGTEFGFIGTIEYRHVYSRTGGAQYGIGLTVDDDIMIVYAEAFDRDEDEDDFDLEAIIAHECGHQRLHRDPSLRPVLEKIPGEILEEVLASIVGSILLGESESSHSFTLKATADLCGIGVRAEFAEEFVYQLTEAVRRLL